MAVGRARTYIAEGYAWVADVDLDRFFDRVSHDVLMARVARRVGDRRLLGLIRRSSRPEPCQVAWWWKTTRGRPRTRLSPHLSNIMMDDLDKELQRRGHRFVRYADDLRVYVRSERAAGRALEGLTRFVEGAKAQGQPGEVGDRLGISPGAPRLWVLPEAGRGPGACGQRRPRRLSRRASAGSPRGTGGCRWLFASVP